MSIFEENKYRINVYEGFLRRAATLDFPFMLKGSYVTRQYFPNPEDRIPNDLDWLYLNPLNGKEDAAKVFNEWMIAVSETVEMDGVQFRSFRENAFWRGIDYAMDDDFPTVNTDLDASLDGGKLSHYSIDVSYNLPVDVPPVPLLYTPLRGKPFTIPYTVPLALQVAWKLHQTLVRPRFKDLLDLKYLVVHADFTNEVLLQSLQALVKECAKDKQNPAALEYLLNGKWSYFFSEMDDNAWVDWRHPNKAYRGELSQADFITDVKKVPYDLAEFKEQFKAAFKVAGFYDIDLGTLNKL
jgi:hypothetical protein